VAKRLKYSDIFFILFTVLFVGWAVHHVTAYDNDLAARVVLAESADQGMVGMIAVGEVIRHRGQIKGFSVLKKDLAAFETRQSDTVYLKARLAWFISQFTNFTHDADHFENVKQFGKPPWADTMRKTVRIKDMQYYKSNQAWPQS